MKMFKAVIAALSRFNILKSSFVGVALMTKLGKDRRKKEIHGEPRERDGAINAAPFNVPIPNNDQLFQFQQALGKFNPNGKRLQNCCEKPGSTYTILDSTGWGH